MGHKSSFTIIQLCKLGPRKLSLAGLLLLPYKYWKGLPLLSPAAVQGCPVSMTAPLTAFQSCLEISFCLYWLLDMLLQETRKHIL